MWDPGAGDGAGSMPGTASEYSLAAQPWGLLMDGGGERGRKESRMSPKFLIQLLSGLSKWHMVSTVYQAFQPSMRETRRKPVTQDTMKMHQKCVFFIP